MNKIFRRDCASVAWFWLHSWWKKWMKKCTNGWLTVEKSSDGKKMWAEVDFLFVDFILLCRFFQLQNGLHNSSKKTIELKNSFFIVRKKVTLQMQYWITVDYIVSIFLGLRNGMLHPFESQSNADVSSTEFNPFFWEKFGRKIRRFQNVFIFSDRLFIP